MRSSFPLRAPAARSHLTMELLNRMAGLQFVHIPYKGTAPSILDLVAGRVSVTSASAISTIPHVRAGRLRALAVASAKRSPSVPDLPTIAESGVPGFGVDQWYAVFGPAGMPKEIIAKLYAEIARTVAIRKSASVCWRWTRSGRHATRGVHGISEGGNRQMGKAGARSRDTREFSVAEAADGRCSVDCSPTRIDTPVQCATTGGAACTKAKSSGAPCSKRQRRWRL